jgi:phage terminase Nu1 subunit (DNA packaging protein)
MIELASAGVVCTTKQLSEIIGISSRQVERFTEAGVLKAVRSSKLRGRCYRLAESVQRFITHEKQRVAEQSASRNGSSGYNRARERRMNALATLAEYETALRTGELLERSQVMMVIDQGVTATKSRLLGVPNKCMHQLAMRTAPEANQIVKAHIVQALRELSRLGTAAITTTSDSNCSSARETRS